MAENEAQKPVAAVPSSNTSEGLPAVQAPGTPAGPAGTGVPAGEEPRKPLTFPKKIMWAALALFSGFWIFFPEPTDVIPFLGWLDEGFAFVILLTSISRLFRIKIPFLTKYLDKYIEKKTAGLVKPD